MFTDLSVTVPNEDVKKAVVKLSYNGTNFEREITIENGVANLNISEILGEFDSGEPGVSVQTAATIGSVTVALLDADDDQIGQDITVTLKIDSEDAL